MSASVSLSANSFQYQYRPSILAISVVLAISTKQSTRSTLGMIYIIGLILYQIPQTPIR